MFTVVDLELPSFGQDAEAECGSTGKTGTGSNTTMDIWVSCPVVPITMTMHS